MLRLQKLNVDKSPGVDEVYAYVLKERAGSISVPLKIIYDKSIDSANVPELWKLANITLLSKRWK